VNVLAALSYGDRRVLINTLRELRKHPGRLVLWSLYALGIVGIVFAKVLTPASTAAPPDDWRVAIWDFWACGFVVAFGVVLASGTSRTLGVFSSRTEALLLTRAAAPPLAVAAYLQMRAVLTTLAQGIGRFAYLILFGIPAATTWHALAAQVVFFAAGGAAVASIALPRALARGASRIVAMIAGTAIAIVAALPILADTARLLHIVEAEPLLRRFQPVHPGFVLNVLIHGDLWPIAIPLAVAIGATVAFVLAARDAYPELYAISLAHFEWRTRWRNRRDPAAAANEAAPARVRIARFHSNSSPFRGAFALVWTDMLTFSRRVAPAITALAAAGALAAGAGLAAFAQRGGDLGIGVIVGMVPGFYVAIASTMGLRLAPAMRMPLFWLGSAPLAARLTAWTLGPYLRDATLAMLAVAGYIAVARDPRAPLIILVAALALLALTRAVGLAVFAVLPNALDQRGPAVFVRTLLTFVLVTPPIIAGTMAAFFFPTPFAGVTIIGALTAFAEATILIAFAANRLSGHADRLTVA
jgi:hypothetical protein